MRTCIRVLPLIGAVTLAIPASAQELPAVIADTANPVPACVTPGRLMAYLRARNTSLDDRFAGLAAQYRRSGEALGIRWDYAFFQMMLETAGLSFRRVDGRPGRVTPAQNNFAGLGIAEGGAPGASYEDVASGVRAHLERVARYALGGSGLGGKGGRLQAAAVQPEPSPGRPQGLTYADLAQRWAPADPAYAASLEAVARRFFDRHCNMADPEAGMQVASEVYRAPSRRPDVRLPASAPEVKPELRAEFGPEPKVETKAEVAAQALVNADLVRQAAARAAEMGLSARSYLGATSPSSDAEIPPEISTNTAPSASVAGARAVVSPIADTQPDRPRMARAAVALVPPTKPSPKSAANATDAALNTLVSGRTVLLDTPVGSTIPIQFRENGTMQGQAGDLGFYLGARTDEGKWWVSRAQLCQRWKTWFDRETQCLKLRQVGQTIHWTSDKGQSGTARIANR